MCVECKVVNVRDHDWKVDSNFIYVGRANAYYGFEGSKFGNPYRSGRDGTLEEVLEKYRQHLWRMIQADRENMIRELAGMAGRTLGCWCAPKGCHANVLAKAIKWATKEWHKSIMARPAEVNDEHYSERDERYRRKETEALQDMYRDDISYEDHHKRNGFGW